MTVPKPLFPGARVALLAPASAVPENRLQLAIDFVRKLEMEPVVYPSCYFANRDGYFAATDAQRANELNEAFGDKSIDGIWCIRGGYGAHRLQPLLDTQRIRSNPKWFGGYSDITALHIYLNQICDLETYHCTMPSTEFDADEFTLCWLKKALFGGLSGVFANPENQPSTTLTGGSASGILCGGNLSLVAASLGTPWEIDTRGKILFLEDVNEEPYRIDGMLQQMAASGKLREAAGIVLGYWTDCTTEHMEKSLTLREVFEDLIVPAGVPAVMNLACGHSLPSNCLPLGARVKLDADRLTLTIEEDGQ